MRILRSPLLINAAIGIALRAIVPMAVDSGGERYLYSAMRRFFPFSGCVNFHCFRFAAPLIASWMPLQTLDAFVVVGTMCTVLAATVMWYIANHVGLSERASWYAVLWMWAAWGPIGMAREPLLVADPVQILWNVTALFLLLKRRYAWALIVLVAGAGVKEAPMMIPFIYVVYVLLERSDLRPPFAWIAALGVIPLVVWIVMRRLLIAVFHYVPNDASYLHGVYSLSVWLPSFGVWPRNILLAAIYVFAGFGAAWFLAGAALGRLGDSRLRALAAATAPAAIVLALVQEPQRAVNVFPFAVVLPAGAYSALLPLPLNAALLAANAMLLLRMAGKVAWLPPLPASLALAFILSIVAVLWRRRAVLPAGTTQSVTWRGFAVPTVVVVMSAMLIAQTAARLRASQLTRHTTLELPAGVIAADDDFGTPAFAIAPNSEQLAVVARRGAARARLWVARLREGGAQELPDTDGASAPFWSPDGRAIGFFAEGQLRIVDVATHRVRRVAPAVNPHGGAWSGDAIVFAAEPGRGLHRVLASGGDVTDATVVDRQDPRASYRWPTFLDDGDHFLFVERNSTPESERLRVGSLGSVDSRRVLQNDARSPAFAGPGAVLYGRWDALRLQLFDTRRLAFDPMESVVELPLAEAPGFSRAALAVSDDVMAFARKTAAAVTLGAGDSNALTWFDRSGRQLSVVLSDSNVSGVDLSRDGRWLTTCSASEGSDHCTLRDLETSQRRDVADPIPLFEPLWNADRSRVAIAQRLPSGRTRLLLRDTRPPARDSIVDLPGDAAPNDWSPDGRTLLFSSLPPTRDGTLWALSLDDPSRPVPIARASPWAMHGQFSPDGRWVAYAGRDREQSEIFVEPFPPTGRRWIVSSDGGDQPRWASDGELTYLAANRFVMSAALALDADGVTSRTQRLFEVLTMPSAPMYFQYALSPRADRVLVNVARREPRGAAIELVFGWRSNVLQLAATRQ